MYATKYFSNINFLDFNKKFKNIVITSFPYTNDVYVI